MSIKLTRQQVLNLFQGLVNVSSLKGAKFAYGISRNIQKIRSQSSNFKFSDKQVEYEKKRKEILKDTDLPVGEIDKELEILSVEYKDVLMETEKYLNEEIDIDIYQIAISSIPEDIDAKLLEPIMPVVEET